MSPEASAIGCDQAVEELRRELAEAREQQAATAACSSAIASPPSALRGAFEGIAAGAVRLCWAYDATIHQVDGGLLRLVADNAPIPVPGTRPMMRGGLLSRAVSGRTIH